jgi:hypothetical protein
MFAHGFLMPSRPREESLLVRFGRSAAPSASSIQTGAWSLAFSQPRAARSTPAALRRAATDGLKSSWSMRNEAARHQKAARRRSRSNVRQHIGCIFAVF